MQALPMRHVVYKTNGTPPEGVMAANLRKSEVAQRLFEAIDLGYCVMRSGDKAVVYPAEYIDVERPVHCFAHGQRASRA